jgi:hypothetical protein
LKRLGEAEPSAHEGFLAAAAVYSAAATPPRAVGNNWLALSAPWMT